MTKECFTDDQIKKYKMLLKLCEECGEATQVSSKVIEFGENSYHPDDPDRVTNKQLLSKECGDIFAVIDHMIEHELIDARTLQEQREKKFWILHSKFNTC